MTRVQTCALPICTDIIIIATRKANGDVAVASIPRDTVYFPRASSNGGGTSGTNRVNAMYSIYYKRYGKYGPTEVDCAGMDRFRADVATALGTEIDYWAMIRMIPFSQLVDSIGYVAVDVPGPIVDTYYGHHGVYFPDANGYVLHGNDECGPKPKKCRSGLAYVRSRHGTQAGSANNDFKRAYRQHDFIFAATQRVVERGEGANLRALMEALRPKVFTNLPKTWTSMTTIYDLLKGIRMKGSDRVILGPSTYAYTDGSTPLYTFRLRLDRVHDLELVVEAALVVAVADRRRDRLEAERVDDLARAPPHRAVQRVDGEPARRGQPVFAGGQRIAAHHVLLVLVDPQRRRAEDRQLAVERVQAVVEVGAREHLEQPLLHRLQPGAQLGPLVQRRLRGLQPEPRPRRRGDAGHHARGERARRQERRVEIGRAHV